MPLFFALVLVLADALGSAGTATPKTTPSGAPWEVAAAGAASLAVPKGWRKLDGFRANTLLFRQGDGIGIPAEDDTGEPLQAGLVLEELTDARGGIREVAAGVIAGAKKDARLKPVADSTIEPVELSDSTKAVVVTSVFLKEGHRRSLQLKLIARGSDARTWMVSGFLVGGKDSRWCAPGSELAKWIRAHLMSLRLTPGTLDEKPLRQAYLGRERVPSNAAGQKETR
jgi:hypothetical protein